MADNRFPIGRCIIARPCNFVNNSQSGSAIWNFVTIFNRSTAELHVNLSPRIRARASLGRLGASVDPLSSALFVSPLSREHSGNRATILNVAAHVQWQSGISNPRGGNMFIHFSKVLVFCQSGRSRNRVEVVWSGVLLPSLTPTNYASDDRTLTRSHNLWPVMRSEVLCASWRSRGRLLVTLLCGKATGRAHTPQVISDTNGRPYMQRSGRLTPPIHRF